MRFVELNYRDKVYRDQKTINKILEKEGFHWLIDSEIESAKIIVKNGTLIWESGNFYSGFWKFGIFKDGVFFGTWENGIFEGGDFRGKWISGIKELI